MVCLLPNAQDLPRRTLRAVWSVSSTLKLSKGGTNHDENRLDALSDQSALVDIRCRFSSCSMPASVNTVDDAGRQQLCTNNDSLLERFVT